jgi:hypothetical protein
MAIQMPDEKWIQSTMKTLDLTREEALEMWCDDHDIDMGKAKEFDLDPEKQKVVKQMTKAGGKARATENKPRERKPNEEKREIIKYLAYSLGECDKFGENFAESVETVNVEREITFKIGENAYSLTLTLHRKPKK